MKRVRTTFHQCLVLLVFGALSLSLAHADVEWRIARELKLDSEPLDIAQSQDERNIFILTRGKILFYSLTEDKVKETIPVPEAFDRLRVSPKGNFLILGSGSEKTIEIVQFKIIQEIDISGLPYRGPKDAPVTIAVFSDYQ